MIYKMNPFTMNANNLSPHTEIYENTNANNLTVCQSCLQNTTGIDLNLIREKSEHSLLEENFVTVKCLDCNHFLCFICYLAHGSIQYFQHHRFETTPLERGVLNKRKLNEINSVEDSFFFKTAKVIDWPPVIIPNADLSLDSISLPSVISPDQSPVMFRDELSMLSRITNKTEKIKNQIRSTFDYCEQILALQKKTLINELKERIKEVHTDNYENIEFITNLNDMESCIKDMVGYIKWPLHSCYTDNSDFGNALKPVSEVIKQQHENFQDLSLLTPHSLPLAFAANEDKKYLNPISHINLKFRARMELELKFGGKGLENNRFVEPNGLSIDKDKNIIVADSNSNYMKCFDPNGAYRFKFGIEKLLFPNKVACHKETGNFVIIERKPAHEIKIFSPNGEFIRRFGSGLLRSPRGVCIDRMSRIIILESKIMRILIFTMDGGLIHYFDVSEYFKFANSLCTSNTEDIIYISDNLSHYINVFSYEGIFLRRIGGPGLTMYPTSVDMNSKNELLITDNFNCFNLTILSENGDLLRAFESKTKHTRLLDVSVVDDDSIMFSSRDNYIYKYKF